MDSELTAVLDSLNAETVVEFFRSKSEEERLGMSKEIMRWLNKHPFQEEITTKTTGSSGLTITSVRHCDFPVLQYIGTFAFLAAADITAAKKGIGKKIDQSGGFYAAAVKAVEDVLPLRPLEWRNEYFDHFISKSGHNGVNGDHWLLYRRFCQAEILTRHTTEAVVSVMLAFVDDNRKYKSSSLVDFCQEYPEVAEDELFFIFENEFTHRFPFYYWDMSGYGFGYSYETHEQKKQAWQAAFIELTEKGIMDRQRLLDASLKTLTFNYPDTELRWYAHLHRELKPDISELKQQELKYLELLGSRNPSAAALAFDELAELDKTGHLDDSRFLQYIPAVFNEKPKARPKKALDIVAKIAKRSPVLLPAAAETALKGLAHEATEVQTAAAKILQDNAAYCTGTGAATLNTETLNSLLPFVQPSVQAILQTFLNPVRHVPQNIISQSKPAIRRVFGTLDLPRLGTNTILEPVQTVDELIDLCSRVLESPTEIDGIELLIDGISRLHTQKGTEFRNKTSGLRKRLLKANLSSYTGMLIYAFLSDSVDAASDRRTVYCHLNETPLKEAQLKEAQCKCRTFSKPSAITPPSGISYRLTVPSEEQYFGLYVYFLICRIADNTALQILAVPTHHGGWLDPLELVRRIKNDPYQLDRHNDYDKSLSLYRLPADNRKEALKELGNYLPDNDYVNAVRCILSSVDAAADNSIPVKHPHYQIAVIVNRYLADNKPVYKFDWGNPHLAEFLLPLPDRIVENSEVPVLCLSADAGGHLHYENRFQRSVFQWRGNFCPAVRQPFYWSGAEHIKEHIEDNYDYPIPLTFLEPMLDPNEPLDTAALRTVLVMLAAKPESWATLGQDVLIAAVSDGRIDGTMLADTVRLWVKHGLPKCVRWVKRFTTVSQVSPQHAVIIREMLEQSLPVFPVKEQGALLELLYELCTATDYRIQSDELRNVLAAYKGTGKAAKLAKQFLR